METLITTLSLLIISSSSALLGFLVPCTSTLSTSNTITKYGTLVYSNCSSEIFTDSRNANHSQTLSSLFQDLISHSSQSKFYKTAAGDSLSGISGRFQCKASLRKSECHDCTSKITELSQTLCSRSIAANIRFFGCYLRYETDTFSLQKAESTLLPGSSQVGTSRASKYEIDHKQCEDSSGGGGAGVAGPIEGFEEKRDAALETLVAGVAEGREGEGGGEYETEYESFRVEAECEADLGPCDCGECVIEAVEVVKEDCPTAIAAQVFMDRCSISFQYFGDGSGGGIGGGGGGGVGGGGGGDWYPGGQGGSSGREVAIVVGGAAALVLAFLFLLLLRSCCRSKDEDC